MAVMFERSAASERENPAKVKEDAAMIAASFLPRLFDTHPLLTFVLNRQGQIVYANPHVLDLAAATELSSLIGRRIGEALGCVHSADGPDGCGTGENCGFCGNNRAFKTAIARLDAFLAEASHNGKLAVERQVSSEECNITRSPDLNLQPLSESSLDLRIWTEAIEVDGKGFIMVSAEDISAEKRREVLERVFYHDIANTASGISTILELLQLMDEKPNERYLRLLKSAADQLVEEIESQRALKAAESRELAVRMQILEGRAALAATLDLFAYKLEGKDISLKLSPGTARVAINSDPTLLRRVLVNMIKNAIEAAVRGEVLLAGINMEDGCAKGEAAGAGWAVFWVKNSAVMPEVARRRVFHRSFSTKGRGRGTGTYSMRLLAESYLNGKVSFSSKEGEGTVFEVRIPLA